MRGCIEERINSGSPECRPRTVPHRRDVGKADYPTAARHRPTYPAHRRPTARAPRIFVRTNSNANSRGFRVAPCAFASASICVRRNSTGTHGHGAVCRPGPAAAATKVTTKTRRPRLKLNSVTVISVTVAVTVTPADCVGPTSCGKPGHRQCSRPLLHSAAAAREPPFHAFRTLEGRRSKGAIHSRVSPTQHPNRWARTAPGGRTTPGPSRLAGRERRREAPARLRPATSRAHRP